MTAIQISATGAPMAPKPKGFEDKHPGRFPAGTFARIAAVSRPKETRTAFLQEAVERELERREKGTD